MIDAPAAKIKGAVKATPLTKKPLIIVFGSVVSESSKSNWTMVRRNFSLETYLLASIKLQFLFCFCRQINFLFDFLRAVLSLLFQALVFIVNYSGFLVRSENTLYIFERFPLHKNIRGEFRQS